MSHLVDQVAKRRSRVGQAALERSLADAEQLRDLP
jgi:hypothetical protein